MTQQELEQAAARIALGTFLSCYPDDKSYAEVVDMLINKSEEILIWVVFETHPVPDIIEWMDTLYSQVLTEFQDVVNQ